MNAATLPCPTCSCTGENTHEDRHAGTNQDTCRTCGGTGFIPARTGETAEASFRPAPPSPQAMRAAVELEILNAIGNVTTQAIGRLVDAAVAAVLASGLPGERVRHVKRGSEYEVLGEAEAQVSDTRSGVDTRKARVIADGHMLTVYRGEEGKLWCRFTDEFRDGRFVPVNAAPAQEVSR